MSKIDLPHNQFFTTHESHKDGGWEWYPIDHFFFAPFIWNPHVTEQGLQQDNKMKLIDFEMSGNEAYVNGEKFKSKAAAFRRMADLLESME
jgi:hypothetical protein